MSDWAAFRPTPDDLARLADETKAVGEIQQKLRSRHSELQQPDRAAHQYQLAGGQAVLEVAATLPDNLRGVGLFEVGASHIGIGRFSTGLGCPHLETDPDFLGLMLAFRTAAGRRVDFLSINHPAAPTDDHRQFMALLDATADGAGAEAPFGHGAGELDLFDLLASNLSVVRSLVRSLGVKHGGGVALHVLAQTVRTVKSSTIYQSYWTGVVEIGGAPGKFSIVPVEQENRHRSLRPGARHLTEEWRARQARGPVQFELYWLPYIDEQRTPLKALTEAWDEQPQLVARLQFPQLRHDTVEARAWSALAAEMGANPGNWVADRADSIREPGTENTAARKKAYALSQRGRDVLPEDSYADVFVSGMIAPALAAELERRRARKRELGHIDSAP